VTAHWRTPWLVIPVSILSGLGAIVGFAGTADGSEPVAARVFSGVVGLVLAIVFVRSFYVGLVASPQGVQVRGVWRTHRVPPDRVAGIAMETSPGDEWVMPSVVTTDGRFLRTRWAGRPARSQRSVETAGEVAWHLQQYGGGGSRLPVVLDDRQVEVRGSGARVTEYRSPPTWPEPPSGWRPERGWNPAPDWPAPPDDWQFWEQVDVPVVAAREVAPDDLHVGADVPRHLDMRYRLDREIAAGLPDSNWGIGEVVQAIAWLAILIFAFYPLSWLIGETAANALGEASIGLAVVLAGRKAAKQSGGWRKALGWDLPKLPDLWLGLRWFGYQLLGSAAASIVLYLVLLPFGGNPNVSNVDISRHDDIGRLIVGVTTAVVMAPVVEEFLFRGLFLRAMMRRYSFWPSAIVNAIVFGLVHAPQVDTWQGRVDLAGTIAVFGLIQCLLVRRTGRLGPAMVVHGMLNAVAVGFALS
jgi:membrane protease YdiL (CAAX protease family)